MLAVEDITDQDKGIAIVCDVNGIVRSVVRDELGLSARVPPGGSIVQLADQGSAEKAGRFLLSLQKPWAASDWEISVPCPGGIWPLHFTGTAIQEGFLIVAAQSGNGLSRVNQELLCGNNKQTGTALSATANELALPFNGSADSDSKMYDELTRVNNDLSNMQRELFRRNIDLEKINVRMNQFLGMAAHDLRTPLGVILNYSEFLEEEAAPQLNEEHREFITTIREMSEFMLGLINDLLDVAQFESGKPGMKLQPVDLTELVRHNVALNRVLAAKKQIRIVFHTDTPLPTLMLDHGKIEQVLNNLLSNAMKFSHVGTEITVHLSREAHSALLTITDQGQGIPADDLGKLFKPFSRTRVKSTGGESSTGLGLSIVRRIVEGHGGGVGVESEVGKGTSFHVRLPCDPA